MVKRSTSRTSGNSNGGLRFILCMIQLNSQTQNQVLPTLRLTHAPDSINKFVSSTTWKFSINIVVVLEWTAIKDSIIYTCKRYDDYPSKVAQTVPVVYANSMKIHEDDYVKRVNTRREPCYSPLKKLLYSWHKSIQTRFPNSWTKFRLQPWIQGQIQHSSATKSNKIKLRFLPFPYVHWRTRDEWLAMFLE